MTSRRLVTNFAIVTLSLQQLTPWTLTVQSAQGADISQLLGSAVSQTNQADLTTLGGIMEDIKTKARLVSDYALPAERIKLDAADQRYLQEWLTKGTASGITLDKYMLDILSDIATDPATRTHDLMTISEIIDPTNDQKDDESEPLPQYPHVDTNNRHAKDHGEAIDISGLDQIRCTKVTYVKVKDTNIVTKTEKLDPMPIEFKDQSLSVSAGALADPTGQVGPNTLMNLYGANLNDLVQRAAVSGAQKAIQDALGTAGLGLPSDLLRQLFARSTGPGFLQGVSQVLFGQATAGSRSSSVQLGTSLADTTTKIGSAIVADQLPGLTPAMIQGGGTLDAVARNAASATLGTRLLGPGFVVTGTSGDDVFQSIAYQYAAAKILTLAPSLDLKNLPLGPGQVTASIGRAAATQAWGIDLASITPSDTKAVLSNLGSRLAHGAELDTSLGLPSGTIDRASRGDLSIDQYFELAGTNLLQTGPTLYGTDPTLRNLIYGTQFSFPTPADVYVPPTGTNQLGLIEQFYRTGPVQLLAESDWQSFQKIYAQINLGTTSNSQTGGGTSTTQSTAAAINGTSTSTDKQSQIQFELWKRLSDPTDLVGSFLAGKLTADDWTNFGKRIVARTLSSQPFEQLAVYNYLVTSNHQRWEVPFTVDATDTAHPIDPTLALTDNRIPVFDPDTLAENQLGLLRGDLDLILAGGLETAILPRLGNDVFSVATGNVPGGNGYAGGTTLAPAWTDDFTTSTITNFRSAIPNVPATAPLRTAVTGLTPSTWQPTVDATASQKINHLLGILSSQVAPLKGKIAAKDYDRLTRALGSLSAGRTLNTLSSLSPPPVVADRSAGLSQDALASWLSGKTPTQTFTQTLGVNFLARSVVGASNPDQFAKSLTSLIQNPVAGSLTQFAATYATDLSGGATKVQTAFDRPSQPFSGTDFLRVMAGNRLPLYGALGGSLLGTLANPLGMRNNPAAVKSAIGALPQVFGLGNVPAMTSLANSLGGMVAAGRFDKNAWLVAASQATLALKVPLGPGQTTASGMGVLSDPSRLLADPKAFGLGVSSIVIAKTLDQSLGGNNYGAVRQAIFGLGTGDYVKVGQATIQTFLSSSQAGGLLKGLTPEARQSVLGHLVALAGIGALASNRQIVSGNLLDRLLPGAPAGFTNAMLRGSDQQKVTAALGLAGKLVGLSPEVQAGIGIITSGGDSAKIAPATFQQIDGIMNNLTGSSLPPGFSQAAAGLIAGKINFDQMAKNLGNVAVEQLTKQLTGAFDLKLGLPVGTVGINGAVTGSLLNLSNQINNPLFQQLNPTGWATANLDFAKLTGQIGQLGIGFGLTGLLGKQLSQFEKSLGLPPGTAGMLMKTFGGLGGFSGGGFMGLFGLGTGTVGIAGGQLPLSLFDGQADAAGAALGKTEEQTKTDEICSAAGYYPYVTQFDPGEEKVLNAVYDPNIKWNTLPRSAGAAGFAAAQQGFAAAQQADEAADKAYQVAQADPDPASSTAAKAAAIAADTAADAAMITAAPVKFQEIKDRMSQADVTKQLQLWPGYPGEFHGASSNSQEFQLGKKAAARWKIHELIDELVTAPFRLSKGATNTFNPLYQPGQIIVYRTDPADLTTAPPKDNQWVANDGDYLLPFQPQDARWETIYDDPRIITTTSDGKKIGLLDWSSDLGGYGDGTVGSNLRLKQAYPLEFIHGIQREQSKTYQDAVHFNM